MKLKKHIVVLLVIVCFAFGLRVFGVWEIPPSLSWDEVSIGYNAYSILKTGRDEHGRFLPLDTFIAYGDYKPPLSIYLTVPFVAVFGLNELAVRFPSVLFGTLTVLLTYFLIKELIDSGMRITDYRQKKQDNSQSAISNQQIIQWLPLLSSFLLAISPWHINLSRAGFEANIALFFVVLGINGVLLALKNPKIWYGTLLPFVAAIYTFNSSRYFIPILGFGIILLFRNTLKNQWNYIVKSSLIAFIALLPILPHLFSKEARLRFTEVNIFTDSSVVLTSNRRIEEAGNVWWAKIIYNRRVGFVRSFFIHYFDHFQPDYLFIKGDGNPKFSIQDVGQLYLIEAPFLVIGIFGLINTYPTAGLFLLYWLCAAIIPAAVARETPHALRTLNSLPTWQIFVAFGIIQSIFFGFRMLRNNLIRNTFFIVILLIYIFNVAYYLFNYYVHYPWMYSGEWQYGYREALRFVSPIAKNYDTVYMTESIGRPYMYKLFYNKTDPHEFFRTKDATIDAAGFYHVYGFDNYRFVKDMPEVCQGKCLYVAPAGSNTENTHILKTIQLLNGDPKLVIYEK